jgi:hypothetical protein
MKRAIWGRLGLIFLAFGLSLTVAAQSQPPAQSQPLGDYARALKKDKPQDLKAPVKVYDNDNIPSADNVSVVGKASADATDKGKAATAEDGHRVDRAADKDKATKDAGANQADKAADSAKPDKDKAPSAEIKPGQSPEERQKAIDAWKQLLDLQKTKVDQLARDLDNFEQNPPVENNIWPDDHKNAQIVADKQKALDQAKDDLSDLQDKARRAGVPNSVID